MLTRIGKVLYWVACIIAALSVAVGVLNYLNQGYKRQDGWMAIVFPLMVATVVWLTGLACRYIFADPKEQASQLSWEETYALRIYEAFPLANAFGNITPHKLGIPPEVSLRYAEKALLLRESLSFIALASAANPDTNLRPVMVAYQRLVAEKMENRGYETDGDAFAAYAFDNATKLFANSYDWAQKWLAEFRADPDDTYMVAPFADHCLKLFSAYKKAMVKTNK